MDALHRVPDDTDISPVGRAECPCGRSGCLLRVRGYLRGPSPRRIDCDSPLLVVSDCGQRRDVWACRNHRESKCLPCSWRYRRQIQRIALSGSERTTGFLYMLTITAPGSKAHRMPSGDLCPCTPEGGTDLSEWNPTAGRKWNHLRTRLRQLYPDLEFMGAAEVQKRGALHRHVILWSSTPIDPLLCRRLAVASGFGHEVDLAPVVPGSRRHAYYVSKYVTKGCDDRDEVPWRADVADSETGEIRRLLTRPTFRGWSSSKGWGLTMAECRAAAQRAAQTSGLLASVLATRTLEPTRAAASGRTEGQPEPSLGSPPT